MFSRWEGGGCGTDFRDDLLCGIHAEPWDFGEALHCL